MELERDGMGRMGHTVTTTGGANNMTSIVAVTSECGMRLNIGRGGALRNYCGWKYTCSGGAPRNIGEGGSPSGSR